MRELQWIIIAPGIVGLARHSSRTRKQIEPVFVQCTLSQFQVKGFRAGFRYSLVLDIAVF